MMRYLAMFALALATWLLVFCALVRLAAWLNEDVDCDAYLKLLEP